MLEQKNVKGYGGTMRLGAYDCHLKKGTKAHEVYGANKISERHRHRYEVNTEYIEDLKKAGLEVDVLGYYQQAGKMWQLDSGYAIYSSAYADIKNVRLKAGYMWNNDFISMYGSPFFGSVSTKQPGGVFDNPQLVHWGLEYTRSFGKYFSFGADLSVWTCWLRPQSE